MENVLLVLAGGVVGALTGLLGPWANYHLEQRKAKNALVEELAEFLGEFNSLDPEATFGKLDQDLDKALNPKTWKKVDNYRLRAQLAYLRAEIRKKGHPISDGSTK